MPSAPEPGLRRASGRPCRWSRLRNGWRTGSAPASRRRAAHAGGGAAAPPRQLRPCRLPMGGTAVHAAAGRAAEAGVRLRQLLQAVDPRGSRYSEDDERRAAIAGLAAIGAASLVVNQPMKMAGERHRPDRDRLGVPQRRWVPMPSSTSFPSGHSASAAAFAVAVGDVLPALRLPLRAAASIVAFSRVYTGVH